MNCSLGIATPFYVKKIRDLGMMPHQLFYHVQKYHKDTPVCPHLYQAVANQKSNKSAGYQVSIVWLSYCSNKSHCARRYSLGIPALLWDLWVATAR